MTPHSSISNDMTPHDAVIFVEGAPVPGQNARLINSAKQSRSNTGINSCRQSGGSTQSYPQTAAKNNASASVASNPKLQLLTQGGTSEMLKKSLDNYNSKQDNATQTPAANNMNGELIFPASEENTGVTKRLNVKNNRKDRINSDQSTTAKSTISRKSAQNNQNNDENTGAADAAERETMLDIADIKPTPPILVIMLIVFFVLYVSQVFVFDILGKHGIPFRGGGGLKEQPWSLIPEIPNYFAMAMVGFLPCKKTLWQLNRRQVFSAIFVATIDLTAQCLSKTGQVMLNTLTLYIIINSAFGIIFTAIGARLALGKKLNIGQYIGILIVIAGVAVSARAKAEAKAKDDDTIAHAKTIEEQKTEKDEELAAEHAFFLGLILVITSTVADGIGFVANEKLMNEGVQSIPGTLLCCIIGLWNSSVLLLWQVCFTFPRWDQIITEPMKYLWSTADPLHNRPQEQYGRADVIFKCIFYIFASGFFCRVATMYLLKHVGAITFVVIKMLKIGAVATLSVLLGYEEFSVLKTVAATIITCGVGVYSYAKIRAIMGERAACTAAANSSESGSQHDVNNGSQPLGLVGNKQKGKLVNIGDVLERTKSGDSNPMIVPGIEKKRTNSLTNFGGNNGQLNFEGDHNEDDFDDLESQPSSNHFNGDLGDRSDSEAQPFLYQTRSCETVNLRGADADAGGGQ